MSALPDRLQSLTRIQKEWPSDENVPPSVILKKYDVWEEYDTDMERLGYRGDAVLATRVEEAGIPKDGLIIDIGCGTGLVGIKMAERGYCNLHGHDGSAPILEKAKQTGVYKKLFCCFLGDGNILPVDRGTYDGIVMAGGASPGHFMLDAFDEMIRVIKPGGFLAHTCRESNLHKVQHAGLLDYFQGHVNNSVLKPLLDEIYENYYSKYNHEVPGRVQIFKVLKNEI